MSRNPYLAASRSASSFTRSSRTSKRNDPSSSKGSLLGRSRSSASLSGGLSSQFASNSFSSATSYVPTSSSWQRSSTSNRLNRLSNDPPPTSSYKSSDYTPAIHRDGSNISGQSLESNPEDKSSPSDLEVKEDLHNASDLKNYQQSKLDQPNKPQIRMRSSLQSLDSSIDSSDTRRSISRVDSSASVLTCDDTESVTSSNVPDNMKHGQLLKSQSLDISKQPPDSSSTLLGSLSVDRLLARSESMTEKELRRCYKDLVLENERLKRRLQDANDREKQKQQDWIRKERQMQRKLSELEEENRQLEQWRLEFERLKDENRSLVRVVSRLSKKD